MDSGGVRQIISALGIIYEPKSTNFERREAQSFLETVKLNEESPYWGFQLALPENNQSNYIVRHFGLSLLQSSIRYKFHTFDSTKISAIKNWIIELANKVEPNDPHYIKEKIAFLWVSLAKRIWGYYLVKQEPSSRERERERELSQLSQLPQQQSSSQHQQQRDQVHKAESRDEDRFALEEDEDVEDKDDSIENGSRSPAVTAQEAEDGWVLMDANLWTLWNNNITCRELSLTILRTLFEDVYLLEDPIASKNSVILNQLSVLIVTPNRILDSIYQNNPRISVCKFSTDGWFIEWSRFLLEIMSNNEYQNGTYSKFVSKILSTFKTCLHWIHPTVLREENIMQTLINILSVADVRIKTLAVDCLHILFTRTYAEDEDFDFFIGSVFTSEGIAKFSEFYQSLTLDPDDIDEQVYSLLKKTVEMIVSLSEYLNITSKYKVSWEGSDVSGYLRLVLSTTDHPSLIISGLSLQMWVTILRFDELSAKQQIIDIMMSLLNISADRVINFIWDDENISKKFFDVDFDSTPDANSFLQNYRKFNEDIIRITVCKKPEEGLLWLENRLQNFFSSELGRKCINEYNLGEKSKAFNYGSSQFNIIENSIRGISRWRIWYNGEDFDTINDRLNKLVIQLGERLLAMSLASPLIIRKQVQTLVQFAPLLKDVDSPLMFQILEKILTTATFPYPPNINDEDRELIRDLRASCGTELNRLAYIMPEALKKIFDDLENVVANILSSKKVSDHENVAFKSFLLVIASRSSIDDKNDLFAKIVDPDLAAWSAPETEKGLMDLHWFMERIGIVQIASYFQSRGITATTNLLEAKMDDEGKLLKTNLKDHWSSIFPIRATRIFIQYSIEKLSHESPEYVNLLKLWKPRVQPIVPHILQLLTQIQAYHNPENWVDLPAEVQSFVKYSCTERFWQQGVSIQSKETFIEENVKAALTLRDFADSVGHLIRYTREYAFLTVGSLAQLEDTLYEIPNIATMLWKAVAGDTVGVTLHSWKHMINSCLRVVIKFCPVKYVEVFMCELLPKALVDIDNLIVSKWDKIYKSGLQLQGNEDDETLSEEMMEEHMLRQLTATVVRLLMDIVGQYNAKALTDTQFACRKLIIEHKEVLAPFLQICCHIINFKDTKCSFNTILVIRNIVNEVTLKDDEVDTFLCDYLIKALLRVLLDDYFVETHGEAALALTTLYCQLRSKNDYAARVLMQNLPNIKPQHISNFESLLVSSKSLRHQRAALLELVRISKDDVAYEEEELNKRKKELGQIARRKKVGPSGDVMNDPFTENGALSNLFGDE
ncbi:MSN5 [Candida oxycetoniae]|uniref:MSN5 n=1 Tax=Candida oxycetoniae TaxID=497107 RepID=A0AAI9T016_9ASCO|nr:MSN5 [Candida oxycetoniae]KAI3405520.2 MSN5 [Candida oxycetoniae]